jgi:NADH-quinone oxidoreductase subunit F
MTQTTIDLMAIKEQYDKARSKITRRVILCAGTGCVANGALRVFKAFVDGIAAKGLDVVTELKEEAKEGTLVSQSGCQGFC